MSIFLPKGTRDFLPEQMHQREYAIRTLREVFTRYGFEPLETPAFERIETLTGKYGEDSQKLIFKIRDHDNRVQKGRIRVKTSLD